MNQTETQGTTGTLQLLSTEEGVNDIWWPYTPGPKVGKHTNKVLGEQTEGRLFQTLVSYPRGAAPPLHIHHDADETFFVLEGEVTIFVGDEQFECTAGDFVLGPKGVPHAFLVRSEWAEMLVSFSPAGIDGFFAEVAPAVIPGEAPPAPSMPDQDEFVRLMAKYECEFVGPPPTLADRRRGGAEMTQETTMTDAFAVRGEEGEARWWLGALAVIKASAADTGGHLTVVDVTDPPGVEAPLHVHHREDEAFWILGGDVTFEVGGKTIEASAGDFVFGPRDVPHRYKVGDAGSRMLFILTPGGFEELVRATSDPARSRTLPPPDHPMPDEEQMMAAQAAAGCALAG